MAGNSKYFLKWREIQNILKMAGNSKSLEMAGNSKSFFKWREIQKIFINGGKFEKFLIEPN